LSDDRKKAYQWDYEGHYDPARRQQFHSNTFSVGIFQWLPKKSGGLKKGTVHKRIRGFTSQPQEVYDKAIAECNRLNGAK
jgi:hypothetical protein